MISVALGVLVGVIVYVYMKDFELQWSRDSHTLIAKWLSKDKPYESYKHGYIIYANGTRWYIETWVGCKLVWCPESDGDIETALKKGMVEFQATWLDRYSMYKMMKKIIYIHPNLTAPNLYWSIVKLIN